MSSTARVIDGEDDPPPRLLNLLCSDQQLQPTVSFVLGILGVSTFAIATSAAAGVYIAAISQQSLSVANAMVAIVPLTGTYVTVLLSMHLIGGCGLPVTVRLALIYGTLYLSLAVLLGNFEQPARSLYVLYGASFCAGSFLLRSYGNFSVHGWKQNDHIDGRITTRGLLDITAAIALTLWMFPPLEETPLSAYLCYLPAAVLSGVMGLHVWVRLTSLSTDSTDHASGSVLWIAGNLSLVCLFWVALAIVVDDSMMRAFGFFSSAIVVFAAHWWTEIPIRWLKACGWSLTRIQQLP